MTLVNPSRHARSKRRQGPSEPIENLCWEPEAGPLDVKPFSNLPLALYQ